MPPVAAIGAALGASAASATAVGAIALTGVGLAIGEVASSISSARNERKSATHAADVQKQIADQQLAATKGAEVQAQKTAETQRRAAVARKSKTILTSPLGVQTDQNQINRPTILGVPQ